MSIGIRNTHERYGVVAMFLHWIIAAAVLVMIGLGLIMTRMTPGTMEQFQLYQLHKSIGITILILTVLRLGWRLVNPVPTLPEGMKPWERLAARATHWGFYALTIALPMTGWAMVSASPLNLPTVLYGTVDWPHLPAIAALQNRAAAEEAFELAHESLAVLAVLTFVLHVGAALRHQFQLKDDVLRRLRPVPLRPEERA